MHAFSNHAVVLHNVTPIDLPAQSAVLSDGVVVACLYKYGAGPFLSSGGEWSAPTSYREFGGTGQCYCRGPSRNTLTRI